MKAGYHPNGRLEDIVFSSNGSQTWQAIQHGLELQKNSVRILRDSWIPHPVARRPISVQGQFRLRCVMELLDHNGTWHV